MNNHWELLATTIARVSELDGPLMEMVAGQQQQLTKPTNALGQLEKLSIRLAGITRQMEPPRVRVRSSSALAIMASPLKESAPTRRK